MPIPYWFKSGSPTIQSHIGYSPGAGAANSNTLTLVPAGHNPGIYLVAVCVVCRVFAAAPNMTPSIAWSLPTVGATSQLLSSMTFPTATTGQLFCQVTVSTINVRQPELLNIRSDGTAAITALLFSAANTGTFDFYASAQFIAG